MSSSRLRRRSGVRSLWARRDLQIGVGTTLLVIGLIFVFPGLLKLSILPWLLVPILAGWLYWGWRLARAEWFARDIRKGLRVLNRDPSALRWELLWFKPSELGGQPLPTSTRVGAEERYELLRKFQGVLQTLGYAGAVVLMIFFSALQGVYVASLYRFATAGGSTPGLDPSLLGQAFVPKKG